MNNRGFSDFVFWLIVGVLVLGALIIVIFSLNGANHKILDLITGILGVE